MSTPETKLTVETCSGVFSPDPSITFHNANREVLRITHEGHIICGEGLSTEQATQEAAKMLIVSFEEQIQKMVDARVAAMNLARAEMAEASAKLWEADALRYANNTEFWKARAEKAEFDLAHARVMVRVLRDALENLRDEQNGAPLCTQEEEWKQAMDRADAALAATKEANK